MEETKFKIVLLNHGKVKIQDKDFYKIEYVFGDKEHYVDTPRCRGLVPLQMFIAKDLSNYLSINDIFKAYELVGEMIPDYQKPMNKKFKLKRMIDIANKNVISVSE